jgi:ABC-type arginine/histidine transport system permease subunit
VYLKKYKKKLRKILIWKFVKVYNPIGTQVLMQIFVVLKGKSEEEEERMKKSSILFVYRFWRNR